jgi:hypothetical protein
MRRNTKQSDKDENPLGIRSGVWLSLLGVTLLGIIALGLSREAAIKDSTDRPFEVTSAVQHSSFAKFKRVGEPAASSQSSEQYADEIDAIDFSIVNDRSRWVDPATRLFQVKAR